MKPAPFVYHRPRSVDEAVQLLADHEAKVLAGGQSLLPLMSMRLASPAALVDINFLPDVDRVEVTDAAVVIGCLTRHRALERDEAAYAVNPLLRRTLLHVSHATIRNRGTTLGSLVHADPAAEMPAVLSLLGGSVEAVSASGRRTIAARDFFVAPLESALRRDELAVSARFPHPAPSAGTSWCELSRRRGDYALVGAGAMVMLDDDARVSSASVALISVSDTPVVVDVTETVEGITFDQVSWSAAESLVRAQVSPEADLHASAEYREQLAKVLSVRALREATADAVGVMAA